MSNNKLLSLLGFAQKSGKLTTGEDGCTLGIKRGKVKFFIIAQDSSNNTKDRFEHLCKQNQIPYYIGFSKDELSAAIGKSNRSVYGIMDRGFANKMQDVVALIGK